MQDRFGAAPWCVDHELPRLLEAASWIVCDLQEAVEGGDHLLLVGQVSAASSVDTAPLIYSNRVFGTHSGFASRPRRPINDHVAAMARH